MTWDISFLVDTQGKIEEARGNCMDILGEPVRSMIGRSLLPFVAGADRAHFRRFLGQLGSPKAVRRALLHLRTAARGERPFFMEAQSGWSPAHYWVMLAVPTDQVGANPLAVLDAPVPTTSDDDLLLMIEMAAAEQATPLDLTVFSVDGLTTSAADAGHTVPADQLRRQVEKSLIANAYDGVVSQSSPGIYNVLHDAETSPDKIAEDVKTGAREIGVTDAQLGLSHRTVKLGVKPDRARIKAAVDAARAPIQDRSLPVGVVATVPVRQSRSFYLIAAVLGAIILGVIVAAVVLTR
jgi:hypothetical protein